MDSGLWYGAKTNSVDIRTQAGDPPPRQLSEPGLKSKPKRPHCNQLTWAL